VAYCGSNLPSGIKESDGRVSVEYGASSLLGDDDLVAIDVMVGQLLGFFRCLHERLKPDAPSETDVINRVVPSFPTYLP
jgi:tagatose-6-phosphate ketose/aldose isomerase